MCVCVCVCLCVNVRDRGRSWKLAAGLKGRYLTWSMASIILRTSLFTLPQGVSISTYLRMCMCVSCYVNVHDLKVY